MLHIWIIKWVSGAYVIQKWVWGVSRGPKKARGVFAIFCEI